MKILEKIKKFVKEHKKEVIVGASAVGVTILACYGYEKTKEKIIDSKARKYENSFREELESLDAERQELRKSTDHYRTATEEQVKDLGNKYKNLRSEIMKTLVKSPCNNKEIKQKMVYDHSKAIRKQLALYQTAAEIKRGKPISRLNR